MRVAMTRMQQADTTMIDRTDPDRPKVQGARQVPCSLRLDPIRHEMPEAGKRAPHILRFPIPVEKEFLLFRF